MSLSWNLAWGWLIWKATTNRPRCNSILLGIPTTFNYGSCNCQCHRSYDDIYIDSLFSDLVYTNKHFVRLRQREIYVPKLTFTDQIRQQQLRQSLNLQVLLTQARPRCQKLLHRHWERETSRFPITWQTGIFMVVWIRAARVSLLQRYHQWSKYLLRQVLLISLRW